MRILDTYGFIHDDSCTYLKADGPDDVCKECDCLPLNSRFPMGQALLKLNLDLFVEEEK